MPHGDHSDSGHTDTGHADVAHIDTHSDVAHGDTAHADTHSDFSEGPAHFDHGDGGPHGDSPIMVSHEDSHTDTAHADSHTDSHGDLAHSDHAYSAGRAYLVVEVELQGRNQGWTDITGDVDKTVGIEGSRGIRTASPRDRVATTGLLNFSMLNSALNSAGLLGYYSPGHANARSGWRQGIGVRALIGLNDCDPVPVWTGKIHRIKPSTGTQLGRIVDVEARDYMDQLARHRLKGLEVDQAEAEHDAFSTVIAEMPVQPRALEVHDGPDTYAYVFDLARDERTVPLEELDRLARSALSLIWLRGDGTLVYEPRNLQRAQPGEPVIELTEADLRNSDPPDVDDNERDVVNLVQTIMTPRTVDAAAVVLYRAVQPLAFQTGGPLQLRGLFTDDGARAFRAGGIELVAPVASTDYVFNTQSDGGGSDVTSQVDVDATFSGNSVLFAVTNNSGATAYATTLQARGKGVLAQERVSFEDDDEDAIDDVGENAVTLEMPYQSEVDVAEESARWLRHVLSQELRKLRSVPLLIDPADEERASLIINRDISDVFSFSETMTGFGGSERFFINAVDFELRGHDDTVWVTWTPAIADPTEFWQLEVVGKSEIGQTTRLGFGFIVGHTDVAHSDGHDDAAHSDTSHVDSHTDDAHGDAGHTDAGHADAHGDASHGDTHADTSHADSAHGDASHSDSHSDSAHGDVSHADSSHGDSHGDSAHTDVSHADSSHSDFHSDTTVEGDHFDNHSDVAHDDTAHSDAAHSDSHNDAAHGDSHNDAAHTDSHNDGAHSDAAHEDSHTDSHSDAAHDDAHFDAGHTDAGHDDAAHGDSHTDTAHADVSHEDSHGDSAHGDAN